ncbi:MAG: hypothetical protein ACRBF0_00545 [Calditrichia bacterium]
MKALSMAFCLFFQIAIAQSIVQLPAEPIFLTEKSIVYTQLSSYGLSESKTDISALSGANPALIAGYKRAEVSLAYQFDLEDEIRSDPFVGRGLIALPQGLTIVYPFNSLVLLAGFDQRSNGQIGPLPITTNTDLDGNAQSGKYVKTHAVLAATAGIGFSTDRFAGTEGRWNLGLRMNANYFRLREEFGQLNSSADAVFPSIHTGIEFQWGTERKPAFSVSLYGDFNPEFTYTRDVELPSAMRTVDSLGNRDQEVIAFRQSVEGKMPDRFGLSALLQPWKRYSIFADVNTLRISEVDYTFISFTDRLDFGLGAIAQLADDLHLSSGVYNSRVSSKSSEVLRSESIDLPTLFLSHGLGIKYGKLSGSLAVLYSMDADFFTRDRFEIKSGFSVEL